MNACLQVIGFSIIAWYFRGSRTYQILFAASVISLVLYYSTSESTPFVVVMYCFIDSITALLLFRFADRAKRFQISLLFLAVIIYFLIEMDIKTGSSVVFEDYVIITEIIVALQMIGAVIDGLYNGFSNIRRNHTDRAEHHYFSHAHSKRH